MGLDEESLSKEFIELIVHLSRRDRKRPTSKSPFRCNQSNHTHSMISSMASEQKFVDFVVEQIKNAGTITAKKMFGEYGIYSDDKLFGLICDNKLFIKPTHSGRAFIGDVLEAPPYEGAKPSFLIEDRLEDRAWLSELVSITVKELPPPKQKTKTKK